MNNTIFKELSNFQKLFAFILLLFCCSILVTSIGLELVNTLIDSNFSINNNNAFIDNNSIRGLKVVTLFSHLGTFIIPALIFLTYFSSYKKSYFNLKIKKKRFFLTIPILFIGISILSEWSLLLNHQVNFSLLSENIALYIEESQQNSELLISRFIGTTWLSFLGNVFVIAIIPAIGEELTFRAVLQPLFINASNKKHISILFVAFIFAFIHFQFMDFIPRFFLGVVYGYLFYFTKNILYSIALHFLNNFFALALLFASTKYNLEIEAVFTQYSFTLVLGLLFTWLGVSIFYQEKAKIG